MDSEDEKLNELFEQIIKTAETAHEEVAVTKGKRNNPKIKKVKKRHRSGRKVKFLQQRTLAKGMLMGKLSKEERSKRIDELVKIKT